MCAHAYKCFIYNIYIYMFIITYVMFIYNIYKCYIYMYI